MGAIMNRLENWPTRLADFIDSRRDAGFVWGERDCCLFAADAVQTITGNDFAASYRGTYSDALGAHRIIAAAGGVPALVPFEQVDAGYAQRGDVVLLDMYGRDVLAVHLGHVIAGQGPDGVTFLAPSTALRVWKVAR